jgi:O-antigen ligase
LLAPGFLFLCLLLGGSAQGVWGNAMLRLIAIGLIGWAILSKFRAVPAEARPLIWLVSAALGYCILQIIPLPFGIWSALPGRETVVSGFELLGIPNASMPLSLTPYDTVGSTLALLPPLGMFAAIITFQDTSRTWLAIALVGGAVAGVLLGTLQVSSSNPLASHWYLYQQSNFGVATGFFANGNHMASLLLAAIPFIAALVATIFDQAEDKRQRLTAISVGGASLLVVIVGLLFNGSLAGYGLAVPVLLASWLLLFGRNSRFRKPIMIAVGGASLAAAFTLWLSPVTPEAVNAAASVSTRQEIYERGGELAANYAPFGSGIGSFDEVYRANEDPDRVDRFYVNHAHNDYLELVVEAGVPGALLLLAFLGWWLLAAQRVLRSPIADKFAVAGTIAAAALLVHSGVDYPLRTAAMGGVFAMCLALMIMPPFIPRRKGELRPARHLVVG